MAELLKKAESPIKEEIVPTKEEVLVTSAHVEDTLAIDVQENKIKSENIEIKGRMKNINQKLLHSILKNWK